MSVVKQLISKPWETQDVEQEQAIEKANSANPFARYTALKWLLAVITVMFMLFFVTFISRTQFADFQALAGEPWLPLTDKTPLWINTAFVVLASMILQMLCMRIDTLPRWKINALILLTMLSTFGFLFGQLWVWNNLAAQGYYLQSNPANSFYYLLTGLHALHLFVGLLVMLVTLIKSLYKPLTPTILRRIDLTRIYWHYLLGLWLVLFFLLTSSTDTFKAIAEFCGL
ncbi:heme-copper oxidase subunit III [Thalassotalea sp. PS06]|uniref:cytochrome c oxidase subunit 3 n=1 Tax=Thalassotalea sp. PS06 TaxID=2594005 RepID=UPI0011651642|nr:cytochrome c oxidase subunit III [Thalassotalea sp. PS06]QDP01323.1 cytochrome c oxidase subunit III [Thalassotalea sp. PS06]